MSAPARKLLIAFAVLGLAASSAATYVHYNLVKNPDYSSFCDINATSWKPERMSLSLPG